MFWEGSIKFIGIEPWLKIKINVHQHNILDEHRVQRYGDDHPEAIEGESGSASVSPKGRGIVF